MSISLEAMDAMIDRVRQAATRQSGWFFLMDVEMASDISDLLLHQMNVARRRRGLARHERRKRQPMKSKWRER